VSRSTLGRYKIKHDAAKAAAQAAPGALTAPVAPSEQWMDKTAFRGLD
jgi:hypothetical protein